MAIAARTQCKIQEGLKTGLAEAHSKFTSDGLAGEAAPDRVQAHTLLTVRVKGLKDEFEIDADPYSLKLGGGSCRSERRRR